MNSSGSLLRGRIGRLLRLLLIFVILVLPFQGATEAAAGASSSAATIEVVRITLDAPSFITSQDLSGVSTLRLAGEREGQPGSAARLPVQLVSIALPPDIAWDSLAMKISLLDKQALPGKYRFEPEPNQQPFGMDQAATQSVSRSAPPTFPISLLRQGQMRKWRYVDLLFAPVEHDPRSGTAALAARLTVELSYKRQLLPLNPLETADRMLDREASERFVNFEQARAWYPDIGTQSGPEGFAIITSNTVVTHSQKLDDYMAYLQSSGYEVELVTEDHYGGLTGQSPNGKAEKIRQWLIENYLSHQIKYVLFIGDPFPETAQFGSSGDVPMKQVWPRYLQADLRQTITDSFFGDLTGNWDLDGDQYFGEFVDDNGPGGVDFGYEVFVGRIPTYYDVGWEDRLDRVLEKIMDYEQSKDTAWRRTALLPMAFTGENQDGAVLAERMISDYLPSQNFTSHTLYQHVAGCSSVYPSTYELEGQTVLEKWTAQPYGLVVWSGHGTSARVYIGCSNGIIMNYTYPPLLSNSHPAFVFSASCDTGTPTAPGNLGAKLLNLGGAVAGFMAGGSPYGYSLGWTPNRAPADILSMAYFVMDRIVKGEPAAEALYHEKSQMGTSYDFNWMTVLGMNLYGSPTTRFFFDDPTKRIPSPPIGFSAQVISSSQIDLSWEDASDNEDGFKLERRQAGEDWAEILLLPAGTTSASDLNLPGLQTYTYRIRSYNGAGNSEYSPEAQADTPGSVLYIPVVIR